MPENVVHLSNLCTEIIEVTSENETAVCNLGSINVGTLCKRRASSILKSYGRNVRLAVSQLDRVIDLNYYAIPSTADSNNRWRNIGLGRDGFAGRFLPMRLPFDSRRSEQDLRTDSGRDLLTLLLTRRAIWRGERGAHPAFPETRAAQGDLQFDLWGVVPEDMARWDALREKIKRARPAKFPDDRDRADGDDRVDRRLLRMHRAAGVEPFQTRNAVGRFRPDQQISRAGTKEDRAVDR